MKRSIVFTSIMATLCFSTQASLSLSTQVGFHAIRHGDCTRSDTPLLSHLGGSITGDKQCIAFLTPTFGLSAFTMPSAHIALQATAEFMCTDTRQIAAGRQGPTDYALNVEPHARLSFSGLYQYQKAAFGLTVMRVVDRYEITTQAAPTDVLSQQDHPVYYYGPTVSFATQLKCFAINTQVGYLLGTLSDHATGDEKITNESVDTQMIKASVAFRYAK